MRLLKLTNERYASPLLPAILTVHRDAQAVLESYLQSLVNLPIKNNDEVIAFLTSDIVRETRQPVMQAGHKEGYLTKRGKNFGGWKTRYFVLSGPVLEYYESVSPSLYPVYRIQKYALSVIFESSTSIEQILFMPSIFSRLLTLLSLPIK